MEMHRKMYKRINNLQEQTSLREQADIYFEELSSGVYLRATDGAFADYVDSSFVLSALNSNYRILVVGKNGAYANFKLSESIEE